MSLTIIIDEKAGPCSGVRRVIRLTEESLAAGKATASLGKVIHNEVEIDRLKSLGLNEVDHSEFDRVAAGGDPRELVIRAHGEPGAVYQRAQKLGITVIDGTCPVVTRSQRLARKYYDEGYQVAIIGKPMHAEVIGIQGHCNNEVRVVHDEHDIEQLDPDRPTYVLAQTTISDDMWYTLLQAVQRRVRDVSHRKTICAIVARRENDLRHFAATCDAVIFVGGRNSSNTRVMVDVCKSVNPKTYWIETTEEIETAWLDGIETVGVSGSASTPLWLVEKTGEELARHYAARVASES
ncbi:MAG TPA: 4-hydroxy-3-methylbut-2-enyl diphosphate reductase [Acidobacteriota bacterium]|nr:4-hydroxy-3-methylbut-2-enyl diphosphate reductase [Acidobacteriota bacterium]